MLELHPPETSKVAQVWHDVLLRISEEVLAQQSISTLLQALEDQAVTVVQFDRATLLLPDNESKLTAVHFRDKVGGGLVRLENEHLAAGPARLVWEEQKIARCNGETFRRDYPGLASLRPYRELGVYCQLPLKTTRQRLGGVEFMRSSTEEFSEAEHFFLRQLAAVIALALENILDRDSTAAHEESVRKERDHYRILVEVTNTVLTKLKMRALANDLADSLHRYFGCAFVSLDLCSPAAKTLRSYSVLFEENGESQRTQTDIHEGASLSGQVVRTKQKLLAGRQQMETLSSSSAQVAQLLSKGFQAVCTLPLLSGNKVLGALKLAHHQPYGFSFANQELLEQICARISIALDNALAYEEISALKDKLASENLYLTEEIRNYADFDEIIGTSLAMKAVLQQVEMVAASDVTVLILGETGTGKELIARAIHQLSGRNAHTMVKMNCAAIPAGLLESDLFGHEKGAYTGAQSQRLGRFELANKGTLFLDEVGDIPLELQPKLLRVLQEREIERLGGTKVINVDVRVIAATNCDLRQMVSERQYRSDLYYRLNVFPIVIPPLRERPEDIPLLVKFFTQKHARRMNRNIESIPSETIARLIQMPWPGNVRELENVIERAIILTRGTVLNLPLSELQYHPAPAAWQPQITPLPAAPAAPNAADQNADDSSGSDRERIIRVLRETNGIVAGPKGAAARLGMKRTTLLSRMQRMGISVKNFDEGEWPPPD